jgi:RNA polymerase sigma factor (sigma-70 family)
MKKKRSADNHIIDTFQTSYSDNSFEILYKQYAHKVYRTCLAITNDSADAQDYTQDIFIKVFDKLNSFQNRSSFSTWLYAISYHYCLDRLRLNKQLKTEPLPYDLSDTLSDEELIDGIPGIRLKEVVERRLQAQELTLMKLPDEELTLLRLKYEQGLSIRDLSEYYKLSESAVKMRLKRTRDKLQALQTNIDY